MKRQILRATVLAAVLVACLAMMPGTVFAAAGTPALKHKVELLLVQNATGVAVDKDKGTLTLKGISPTTLFFSDRPVRLAGHFNQEDYLKLWTDGKDNFDADPPNATLSVFEAGQDDLVDVVVELQNPRYNGDDLIYDITVIEGQLPNRRRTVLSVHRHLRCLAPRRPAHGVDRRGRCHHRCSSDRGRGQCGCGGAAGPAARRSARTGGDKHPVRGCRTPKRTQIAGKTGVDNRGSVSGRIAEAVEPDRGMRCTEIWIDPVCRNRVARQNDARNNAWKGCVVMENRGRKSNGIKVAAVAVLIAFAGAGCAGNGSLSSMTDTTKGGILGGAGGAAIGALIDHANPWAGALIGAAGGALSGAIVGHFMDDRKKNLEKELAPQINAGLVTVQILPDSALLVTTTGATAFAPGSSMVNQGFIPTLQTIANVVKTYGKTTLAVIGHPDSAGTTSERERLANQRAEAVRTVLLGIGVAPILVTASGNPNSRYLDGRVEVVIHPLTSS